MKVWWVLAWENYYPSGALRNVYSTHETAEEATTVAEVLRRDKVYDNVEVQNVSGLLGL